MFGSVAGGEVGVVEKTLRKRLGVLSVSREERPTTGMSVLCRGCVSDSKKGTILPISALIYTNAYSYEAQRLTVEAAPQRPLRPSLQHPTYRKHKHLQKPCD